jgi:putative phosphoribosyl transferase
MRRFDDRAAAGRELADRLSAYQRRPDAVVLGLARGGMPVAFEVARTLQLALDVLIVRKLAVPGQEELAIGAIASGGVRVLNDQVIDALGLSSQEIMAIAEGEQSEVDRRERAYRGERAPVMVAGRLVLVVDDGLATGASMRAALQALKQRDVAKLVVAVPIAPPETCAELRREADTVVCARTPWRFHAVGYWYEHFPQTTDDEVRSLIAVGPRTDPPSRRARITQDASTR